MPNSDGTKLEVVLHMPDDTIEFLADNAVDYVSLVSPETYGKPALVAPGKPGDSRSDVGDTVLFINTRLVPLFEITRVRA